MENTEQQKQETPLPLHNQLAVWLKDHGVQLVVRCQAPRGELVSLDNFVPPGWNVVIGLDAVK